MGMSWGLSNVAHMFCAVAKKYGAFWIGQKPWWDVSPLIWRVAFLSEDEHHRQMERMKLNQGFHTELRGLTQETEEHWRWNNLCRNGWIYSQLQLSTTREWFVGFTRLIQSHSQIGGATVTTNLQCSNFWWFGQCHKPHKRSELWFHEAGLTLKRFWCVELEDRLSMISKSGKVCEKNPLQGLRHERIRKVHGNKV